MPEQMKAAIDAHASEPFSARSWRKLNGLGDPGIEGGSYAYESYALNDEWQRNVSQIMPGNETLSNPAYNCRISYPLEVLRARIAKFGKDSDYVKTWLMGQDAVLRACAGNAATPMSAAPLPSSLQPEQIELLKQDSAYQKASVLFYANPTAAIPEFKAIAASASPHKAAARYNVANILANGKKVAGAREEAKAILSDPSLAAVHDITRELLGYIANIEDTALGWSEMIDDTVQTLSQPQAAFKGNVKAEATYAKALYDIGYVGVAAKKDDWWVTNTLPADATLSKALADAARKHPMVLWMMAGQSVNKPYTQAPWALVGDKWQAWTASYVDRAIALQGTALPPLPKLVLESLKARTDDTSRSVLWASALDAATKANATCGDAPETAAVTQLALQAIRVSALSNRYDEIYANLPQLKLDGSSSLRATLLPKLMEHLLATGNMEEGRRLRDNLINDGFPENFAAQDQTWQREPYAQFLAWVAEDEARWLRATTYANAQLSSSIFNLLPASKLRALGDKTAFPPEQRALLKRAAWTRNYAIGAMNSKKTTADMLTANPDLGSALAAVKSEFPKLQTDRAMLLTILRNPRFGILVNSPDGTDPLETKRERFNALDEYDPNDKNWWCPLEIDRQLSALRTEYDEASGMNGVKSYHIKELRPVLDADGIAKIEAARELVLKRHPMIKAVSWKEVLQLNKAAPAPKLLAQSAIRWAKASTGDDGAPEALALAVRATRFGCRWHGPVKAYSKPAQEMLKAKFGGSVWAAQTPYWFDCVDTSYDEKYNKIVSCKPREWQKQALPK